MGESKIEWTDRSDWNPIRGCTRVSPGCGGPGPHGGCYAEAMAARFSDPAIGDKSAQWGHGYAERTSKGGRWTGKVELIEDRLTLPLRWKRPAKVFASSTSDFFHERLSDADIDQLFAVMAMAPHLTFQVLTKRADRMRSYMARLTAGGATRWAADILADAAHDIGIDEDGCCAVANWINGFSRWAHMPDDGNPLDGSVQRWPLPNVWLGVSVEDQPRADERREDFRATPAAVKFVSYEPALGPVDWTGWDFVNQIISGGESGPRARPNHPDWHRATRDFCAPRGIAYFFKQWGEWAPAPEIIEASGPSFHRYDDGTWLQRVGKKAADRLLDGVQHDGVPA